MGRVTVFRHRDFRLLFIGQSISIIGSQAVVVAMAIYITQRTGSATDLSIILGAETIPMVTLIIIGGVWGDRLPRHLVMIGSDVLRLALHTLLGILIITGSPPIWLIAVIEALFASGTAFFQPAYTGLVPQTVPEDEIQAAQALRGGMENLATVLGPVFATALVLTIGAGEMFLIDAATFLVGALLLIPVRPRRREAQVVAEGEDFMHELRVGLREVTSRPWVWATIVAYTGVLVLVLVPWLSVAPVVFRDVYHHVGYYGVLVAIFGVGAVLASLLATVWHPKFPLRTALICGVVGSFLGLAIALALPLWSLTLVALVCGVAWGLTGTLWETTLARHIPPDALSRVSAWDWMGSLALMPIGYAVVGPLASAFGERWVIGIGAIGGAVMAGMAMLAPGAMMLPAAPPGEQGAVGDTPRRTAFDELARQGR